MKQGCLRSGFTLTPPKPRVRQLKPHGRATLQKTLLESGGRVEDPFPLEGTISLSGAMVVLSYNGTKESQLRGFIVRIRARMWGPDSRKITPKDTLHGPALWEFSYSPFVMGRGH